MRKWGILLTAGIMIMLANLDLTIVNLGLPTIAHALHAKLPQMQWVMSGYMLAASITFILFGKLADKYGKRFIFMLGIVIFVCASLMAAIAGNINLLIIARFLQGSGFAATLGLALVIIINSFPQEQRGLATGLSITITGVSQAIGPTLGGIILSYFSWRWIFLINIPLGLIAFIGTLFFAEKDLQNTRSMRVDYIGLGILMISLASIVITFNQMVDLNKLHLYLGFGIGCVSLAIFFIRCYKHKHSLIPLEMLVHRNYVLITLSRILFMYFMMAMLFIIPIYLINIIGLTAMHAGLLMLIMTTLAAIVSPITGVIIDKIGYRLPLQLSFLAAVICSLILMWNRAQILYAILIPSLLLYGITVGLHISSSINGILVSTKIKHHGVATGLFFTVGMLGGASGVSVSGSILNIASHHYLLSHANNGIKNLNSLLSIAKGTLNTTSIHTNHIMLAKLSFMHAFQIVALVMSILMLLALGLSLFIKKSNI